MEEQLISFETSKLAKEKGINLPHTHYYVLEFKNFRATGEIKKNGIPDDYGDNILQVVKNRKNQPHIAPAYSQSLLSKWLRDESKINIEVAIHNSTKFWYDISRIEDNDVKNIYSSNPVFKTYEDAMELGLQDALKLIGQI